MNAKVPSQNGEWQRVPVAEADDVNKDYGMAYESLYVYASTVSAGPTRVSVWFNTSRPNPRAGAQHHGGRYLDPNGTATDDPVSVLLTPESTVINGYGTGTGSAGFDQTYAPSNRPLRDGDLIILTYSNGAERAYTIDFGRNGHGYGRATDSVDV